VSWRRLEEGAAARPLDGGRGAAARLWTAARPLVQIDDAGKKIDCALKKEDLKSIEVEMRCTQVQRAGEDRRRGKTNPNPKFWL